MRFSLPLPAIRILDPSCPGLTRASIETKRFNEAMDCRVKPSNDDGEAAVHGVAGSATRRGVRAPSSRR
jgi:hypothetical protein